MLKGVGDYCHLKTVALGIAHRKADAIDCDGAFLYCDIALARHFGINVVGKLEIAAALNVAHLAAHCGLVYVPLHYVAVKTSVHRHATLKVDKVANLQQPEV